VPVAPPPLLLQLASPNPNPINKNVPQRTLNTDPWRMEASDCEFAMRKKARAGDAPTMGGDREFLQ